MRFIILALVISFHLTALCEPLLTEDADSPTQSTKPDWATSTVAGVYDNSDTPTIPQFIRLARTSVDIEIYEMADPEVRQALLDALAKGVRVRIVKEPKPIGESCDPFATKEKAKPEAKKNRKRADDCDEQRELIEEIRSNGGAVVAFDKKSLCGRTKKSGNCFQHGKMILIDGDRMALLSTGNFNPTSLCDLPADPKNCNRDYTYITRDTRITKALKEIFEKDLAGKRYDLAAIVKKPEVADRLTVSPYTKEPLFAFLRSAKKRIQIQNQYINTDSGIPEVLIKKAKQGVKIEVQLADVCTFGKPSEKKAYESRQVFAALEDAGVTLRMFNKAQEIKGKPGYLHAKAIVVDDSKAWVGSVNGSSTSIEQNREFGLFFSHPTRVKLLSEMMSADILSESAQAWRDSLQCRNPR